MAQASFPTREEVDFVIVGSGAAGGIMARELSTAGFSAVVLEQGPYLQPGDFRHDEWSYTQNEELVWGREGHRTQVVDHTVSAALHHHSELV